MSSFISKHKTALIVIIALCVVIGVMGSALWIGLEQSGYFVRYTFVVYNNTDEPVTISIAYPFEEQQIPEPIRTSSDGWNMQVRIPQSTEFTIQPMIKNYFPEGYYFPRDLKGQTYILYLYAAGDNVYLREGVPKYMYTGGTLTLDIVRDADGNLAFERIEDATDP